ncbi:hypothetical protein [Chitinophaga sp. LS1]|uniref:hypothetical protein n=1 Tax=Chitinophaga sp. LS1 TaxID=3051176 RepID=UPI002AAB65F2|nr:hypothetical protein [Chitinophaga sp. LS1]WPV67038.1 hypothetical protein QQL36_35185 [Chitinophaga sp. LS1]
MSFHHSKINLTLGLINNAYSDYIAARVLLNKDLIIQGAILASTAIEKYLKVLICACTGKIVQIHLTKLEEIKAQIEKIGYSVLFEKIDLKFLEILSKVYKLRYYDTIKKPTTVGFFKNQFLGELDGTEALFKKIINPYNSETNEVILTPFKRELKNSNPDLLTNNWVATGDKNKKNFMETDAVGFAIHILPYNLLEEIHIHSRPMNLLYEGSMDDRC